MQISIYTYTNFLLYFYYSFLHQNSLSTFRKSWFVPKSGHGISKSSLERFWGFFGSCHCCMVLIIKHLESETFDSDWTIAENPIKHGILKKKKKKINWREKYSVTVGSQNTKCLVRFVCYTYIDFKSVSRIHN